MKTFLLAFLLLITLNVAAGIPATPVMTFYKFNGDLDTPYYTIDGFIKRGASSPAGYLAQGSSVIPCLVIRNGKPLTDRKGIPYVGIEVLVNSRQATLASSELFKKTVAARKAMSVTNHHCDSSVKYVMNVRTMFNLGKAPFFAPPIPAGERPVGAGRQSSEHGQLDDIVQAFHNSPECELANRSLIGRRQALSSAWQRFIDKSQRSWPKSALARAKHLDYTMRTAIFEGHLGRGCNAYGACERNIIALSIRNRGRGKGCAKYQGCRFPGDYQGVASKVSQYNIWDAYLTQISGLTSCFLRALPEPSGYPSAEGSSNPAAYYDKIRSMYNQNVDDVQQILYGDDQALRAVFPATSMNGLERLKHYYHAPAMGKCYPNHDRIEYMSGAVARNGNDFALIANARIKVDQKVEGGYLFRSFVVKEEEEEDVISIVDNYPGFVVDGRRVSLKGSSNCPPYGAPRGCHYQRIGRYRRTPPWLKSGKPLAISCQIEDRGKQCLSSAVRKTVTVGGLCDTQMIPVSAVP